MAGVNETIVSEYFESLGFVVSQPCKYVVPGKRKKVEEEIDLLVVNPLVAEQKMPQATIWQTSHLQNVSRAIVGIRGWHTERFSPAIFKQTPEILRFCEDGPMRAAGKRLGSTDVARILCVAALPASGEMKKKTLEILRASGVDGVIVFQTMLEHLVEQVDKTKNYEKSDLLQMIRIFKSHGLFRTNQMELFGRKRSRRKKS